MNYVWFLIIFIMLDLLLGTAKAEIWRLAVLYLHGGMQFDNMVC